MNTLHEAVKMLKELARTLHAGELFTHEDAATVVKIAYLAELRLADHHEHTDAPDALDEAPLPVREQQQLDARISYLEQISGQLTSYLSEIERKLSVVGKGEKENTSRLDHLADRLDKIHSYLSEIEQKLVTVANEENNNTKAVIFLNRRLARVEALQPRPSERA